MFYICFRVYCLQFTVCSFFIPAYFLTEHYIMIAANSLSLYGIFLQYLENVYNRLPHYLPLSVALYYSFVGWLENEHNRPPIADCSILFISGDG